MAYTTAHFVNVIAIVISAHAALSYIFMFLMKVGKFLHGAQVKLPLSCFKYLQMNF